MPCTCSCSLGGSLVTCSCPVLLLPHHLVPSWPCFPGGPAPSLHPGPEPCSSPGRSTGWPLSGGPSRSICVCLGPGSDLAVPSSCWGLLQPHPFFPRHPRSLPELPRSGPGTPPGSPTCPTHGGRLSSGRVSPRGPIPPDGTPPHPTPLYPPHRTPLYPPHPTTPYPTPPHRIPPHPTPAPACPSPQPRA